VAVVSHDAPAHDEAAVAVQARLILQRQGQDSGLLRACADLSQ